MSDENKLSTKASEILTEINDKLDKAEAERAEILAFLKNINFQYNVILNRLSKGPSIPVEAPKAKVSEPEEFVPVVEPRKKVVEAPPIFVDAGEKFAKTEVFQKIFYPAEKPSSTPKPLPLAKIEIQTENKEKILETRNDSTGRWSAKLPPGRYIVNLNKRAVNNKPELNHTFALEVTGQVKVMELPSYIVKGVDGSQKEEG